MMEFIVKNIVIFTGGETLIEKIFLFKIFLFKTVEVPDGTSTVSKLKIIFYKNNYSNHTALKYFKLKALTGF